MRTRTRRFALSFFAAALTGAQLLAADAAFGRDRAVILERMRTAEPDGDPKLLETFRDDGTWSDVDYADRSRGGWKPLEHLKRACALARTRPAVAVKALAAWVRLKPETPNWWGMCIGAPKLLADTMIRVRMENIPPELAAELRPLLIVRPRFAMTGQNLVWTEGIRLKTGLLYDDPELVMPAREKIMHEVRVAPPGGEGIQRDWSFHQHGTQLQFGNYGLSYLHEQVQWANMLRGTRFAYPTEKIAVLRDYLMEGLRWTLRDGKMDFSACGRQQKAESPTLKYRSVVSAARAMLPLLADSDREKVRAWLAAPASLTGAKAFPNSGYLVYLSPGGWSFSVKTDSAKLAGSETCNQENMKGLYQGDGAAFFGSLSRYEGYPALADARMIPGTTEIQDDRPLVPLDFRREHRNRKGYYAVWADFPVAVAAMRLDTGDLTADKVWFCTASGVTCSGSDIRSDSAFPVVTCADQFRAASGKSFPVVCEVPAGCPPVVRKVERIRADWKDLFHEMPSKKISGSVVKLTIDHGVKPDGAGYFYRLRKSDIPAGEETRLATSSPRIHALTAAGRVLVAAFVPGEVTLVNGKKVAVKPGITVLDPAGGKLAGAAFRER